MFWSLAISFGAKTLTSIVLPNLEENLNIDYSINEENLNLNYLCNTNAQAALKSNNLQYNMLVRWFPEQMTRRTSVWCSKHFFFHNFL